MAVAEQCSLLVPLVSDDTQSLFTAHAGCSSLPVAVAPPTSEVVEEKALLLWVDNEQNDPEAVSTLRQSYANLQIQFVPKFSDVRPYMDNNLESIRAQARFLVICRGTYLQESKTAVDVANLLREYRVRSVCAVYTGSRAVFLERVANVPDSLQIFDRRTDLLAFVQATIRK